jgi:hypothetical protein
MVGGGAANGATVDGAGRSDPKRSSSKRQLAQADGETTRVLARLCQSQTAAVRGLLNVAMAQVRVRPFVVLLAKCM